jgi:DNA-binding phage protein
MGNAKQTQIRRISGHPKITPERLEQLGVARKQVDREKDQIVAKGREVFARYSRIKAMIAMLNSLREQQHMTLEQLAERTGIGKANLSRLFTAKEPNPTIDTLLRVSDAVGHALIQ